MNNIDFNKIIENIDLQLAKSKGLINNNDYSKYKNIYLKYRFGLEQFLLKMTSLSMYDKKIGDSNLGFLEVLEEEKDFYQSLSSLKYFYLRNNLYIERLNNDYLEKLNNLNMEDADSINILIEIVMKTYNDIIVEYSDMDRNTIISFGFDSTDLMPCNGSLIIGFRYDEYRNEEYLGDNWYDNYVKQTEIINKILPIFEEEISKILKTNVKLIQYNEFSVMNKTKN